MNNIKEEYKRIHRSYSLDPIAIKIVQAKADRDKINLSRALDSIVIEWDENNDNKLDGLLNERNELKKIVNKVNLIKCLSDDLFDDLEKSDRPC